MALGKNVFRALAAVVWADADVKPAEADALMRAARAAGLSAEDLGDVERSTKERVRVADLGDLALAEEDAEYAFALACMLSASDGDVAPEEKDVLAELADKLGLSLEARDRAASASMAVAETLGEGQGPLDALALALAE